MKKIIIKKEIQLNAERKGNTIICYDSGTVNMLMGSSSVSSNLHIYHIKRKPDCWVIPIDEIKKRINFIERNISKLESKLEIMKKII